MSTGKKLNISVNEAVICGKEGFINAGMMESCLINTRQQDRLKRRPMGENREKTRFSHRFISA